jgi:hypothetical protein
MIANEKLHPLDPSDMAKFGNGPGATQGSVLAHELVEQYGIQVKGADYKAAHAIGLRAEAYITRIFTDSRGASTAPWGRASHHHVLTAG